MNMPPKTRSNQQQKGIVDMEQVHDKPLNNTKKAVKSAKSKESEQLRKALHENQMLKDQLEELRAKYSEKKRGNKQLKKINEEQKQKLIQLDQYISKLKTDKKIADSIHKHSVSSLINSSAQNQALMAVLSTQQQPCVPQIPSPMVLPTIPLGFPSTLQQSNVQQTLPYSYQQFYVPGNSNQLVQQHQNFSNSHENYGHPGHANQSNLYQYYPCKRF